jgi:hypothetical protein
MIVLYYELTFEERHHKFCYKLPIGLSLKNNGSQYLNNLDIIISCQHRQEHMCWQEDQYIVKSNSSLKWLPSATN